MALLFGLWKNSGLESAALIRLDNDLYGASDRRMEPKREKQALLILQPSGLPRLPHQQNVWGSSWHRRDGPGRASASAPGSRGQRLNNQHPNRLPVWETRRLEKSGAVFLTLKDEGKVCSSLSELLAATAPTFTPKNIPLRTLSPEWEMQRWGDSAENLFWLWLWRQQSPVQGDSSLRKSAVAMTSE